MVALGTYTNVALVESVIGQTFSGTTTPTSTQVQTFIDWANDQVEAATGQVWGLGTVTGELIDWNRFTAYTNSDTGYVSVLNDYERYDKSIVQTSNAFKIEKKPIVDVISVEKNSQIYPNQPVWTALGTADFIINKPEGMITITTATVPEFGLRRFKVSYTYGDSTVPKTVERLATLYAVRDVMNTKIANSNFGSTDSISIEGISISKSTGQAISYLRRIDEEIKRLETELVGVFRTEIF